MTVDRWIRVLAGTFIMLSLALGFPGSPLFVNQWWLAFTAFVGVNLFQSGFTRFCPMVFSSAFSMASAASPQPM